jgi:hypothetical protein
MYLCLNLDSKSLVVTKTLLLVTFKVSYTFLAIEPTRVKHLSGAPLYGRLLASPTNIRLGWKGKPGTNTSLLQNSVNYGRKKFYITGCRVNE